MGEILTLGIDIGGTNLRMGVVNEKGEILSFSREPSSAFTEENAKDMLCEKIENHLAENGFTGKIAAAAAGLPALMSRDKKTVLSAPNVKGFDGLQFDESFEQRLGFPVFADRDTNFLLQNDIEKLGLHNEKNILGFYIGTGFGNSIFLNGEFYSGTNGAAGELGHIPTVGSDKKCTCGNRSCVETIASGKHLEELAARFFPQTDIKRVFKEHVNSPIINLFVQNLAVPIATEINILDIQLCIIGGGVVDMEGFPKEQLFDWVHFYARKPYPQKNLRLIFTKHNQQSGVFGSAVFAQKILKSR
ncbi:MAG: allose kinase [Clostridia bacterium]|nr:allose kinase [Clostridia bacterium]